MKKFIVIYIITLVIILLFLEPLGDLLIKFGSNINIDSSPFIVGYLLIIILIISIYFYLIFKNYIHNKQINFLISIITSIYVLYRYFFTNIIEFLKLDGFLPFADVILIVATLHLINLFYSRKIVETQPSFFIEDSVFSDGIIDNELILNKLIEVTSNFKPEIAFNVGINAVWGYGKSTFLKRFENVFKEKNSKSIVFWYRIWKNKTSTGIIDNFFEELKLQLSPYSGEISNSIDKYVNAVLDLSPSEIQKYITTGLNLFNDSNSLEKYFNEINEAIKKIDRQIVILLDDLDRLDKEEILNSLKLIRTISDFNNVIFIAGYDRKYIVETINQPRDNYLDKIFNVELNLLPFQEDKLTNQLFETIEDVFPQPSLFNNGFKKLFEDRDYYNTIDFNFNSGEKINNNNDIKLTFLNFLPTYRDVKRFINEFKFYASFIESTEDIYSFDYILHKLLVYKYRGLNNDLFHNLDNILSLKILSIQKREVYDNPVSIGGDIYVFDTKAKDKVESILGDKYSNLDKKIILKSLNILFSKKNYEFYEANQNCIAKINYTNFYLRNNIVEGEIKISEFKIAFKNNELFEFSETFKNYEQQLIFSLKKELITFIRKSEISSKEQFKDALKTINSIAGASNYLFDYYESLVFLNKIFKNVYNSQLSEFQNIIENAIIENDSIGFFDYLLSQFNLKEKRYEYNIKKGGEPDFITQSEEYGFLSNAFIKKVLLKKLKSQIEKNASAEHIVSIYHLFVERLVLKNKIMIPAESNKLLKADIEKRIDLYFNSELFNFVRESSDLRLVGFQPNFFLSSIFSNEKTVTDFLKEDSNEDLHHIIYNEGWQNLNGFTQNLNAKDLTIDVAKLNIAKKLIQAFIDNNYQPIFRDEYNDIVN
jgi:hypothetical protein